jgi:N-formylglutamate amidohydrolase
MKAFLISIPHSGEQVPAETPWLQGLPEPILMCDVDRYVDRLYQPVLAKLKIPHVVTEWHRFVVDLNRLPDDIDPTTVTGSTNPPGKFWNGIHWAKTTKGDKIMHGPIPMELHNQLVERYFNPFHQSVRKIYDEIRATGAERVYHLDAHSMPSMGTSAHKDPGQKRKDIVVSDCEGTSCSSPFKDLVIKAYQQAGLEVGYNWPYGGGRVTQTYGKPQEGQHAIQVEISRALYMDETSKKLLPDKAAALSEKLGRAVEHILRELPA